MIRKRVLLACAMSIIIVSTILIHPTQAVQGTLLDSESVDFTVYDNELPFGSANLQGTFSTYYIDSSQCQVIFEGSMAAIIMGGIRLDAYSASIASIETWDYFGAGTIVQNGEVGDDSVFFTIGGVYGCNVRVVWDLTPTLPLNYPIVHTYAYVCSTKNLAYKDYYLKTALPDPAPQFTSTPPSPTLQKKAAQQYSLAWSGQDNNPWYYTITGPKCLLDIVTGTSYVLQGGQSYPWTSNSPISFPIPKWIFDWECDPIFTCNLYDFSGNVITSPVTVHVRNPVVTSFTIYSPGSPDYISISGTYVGVTFSVDLIASPYDPTYTANKVLMTKNNWATSDPASFLYSRTDSAGTHNVYIKTYRLTNNYPYQTWKSYTIQASAAVPPDYTGTSNSVTVYVRYVPPPPGGGGGGCPNLLVWNGSTFVDEGLLNIHNLVNPDNDIVLQHTLNTTLALDSHNRYTLELYEHPEGYNVSHSWLNQALLYAVDTSGMWHRCNLVSAIHSRDGSVLPLLLREDCKWAETYYGDKVVLQFTAPDTHNIDHFVFVLVGHNMK